MGELSPAGPAWTDAIAAALTLLSVYAAVALLTAQRLRAAHLALALPLVFLLDRKPRSRAARVRDAVLALAAALAMGWAVWDFHRFVYRAIDPSWLDVLLGTLAMATALEAARRVAGPWLPALALVALVYAVGGAYLPEPWTHRGYGLRRVVGLEYMGLEGLFGAPAAVSVGFVVLFALYGAVLDRSGASQSFLDLSLAAVGKRPSGPGRAVVAASFLLGGPSGSGVATALSLGSVAWPLLRRAGYDRERAGALLSAGALGAVLSPPVMGAAAFLIAELARVPYVEVLRWSIVPAALYYLSLIVSVELDASQLGIRAATLETRPLHSVMREGTRHLTSLVVLVGLLVLGYSAARAVLWASAVAVAVTWLRPRTAVRPSGLWRALAAGGKAAAPVAAVCAAAGVLVGVVNLTGLGLKLSGLVLDFSGGRLLPALGLSALVLLLLGLALPITAAYVVAATVAAPALVRLGVPEPAAHMFIFFFALLSEVTPPTALSCMAVSAITGGHPYRTMWLAWRYTLPAFLVPFLIALPGGTGLLLIGPPVAVARVVLTALLGSTALVVAVGTVRAGAPWRLVLALAGLLLLLPSPAADMAGAVLGGAGWLGGRWMRNGAGELSAPPDDPSPP